MDESRAWLNQARADRESAERELAFIVATNSAVRCHAAAKYQQAVEKAVKAVLSALVEARVLHVQIGYGHGVERWVQTLVRLPSAADRQTVQRHLKLLFDPATRAAIRALEDVTPKRPADGRPRRNTEYPFLIAEAEDDWTHPSAPDVFARREVDRFRELSYRILTVCGKVISAIKRGPQ